MKPPPMAMQKQGAIAPTPGGRAKKPRRGSNIPQATNTGPRNLPQAARAVAGAIGKRGR